MMTDTETGTSHSEVVAPDPATSQARQLTLAFAPLHKRALGLAVGLAFGLVIFTVTVIYLLQMPVEGLRLGLLRQYFYGYRVSWTGALVGFGWGMFTGFVVGWFVAFTRNFAVAAGVFLIRAKADLLETRDFLDHI